MFEHTKAYHCISCGFFNEHIYDQDFLVHECLWNDEEEVQAEQLNLCPECGDDIVTDEDSGEDYCPGCGLVVSGPYLYVAGERIDYPYGLKV
jgi:predicted RNA-binding Zn-ribbon protein involved in translation (DUF1610 family)